jgi:squalene-hopene/tetraprenyl-beta-curcumene cyclase
LDSVRPDGSWPIDTNLATWTTTLAINALAGASEDVAELGGLDWLLSCQHRHVHPFTGAAPSGWGWTDLSGAVPDADDTSGTLLALMVLLRSGGQVNRQRIEEAALAGVDWLLAVQNADGGWPTFCRGWGRLGFDRSGTDLTAHAIRALHAWQHWFPDRDIDRAIRDGLDYLAGTQRPDGSWRPLWFGNQYHAEEENPVYGTARVLLAYRDLGLIESEPAQRGLGWLAAHADAGGGWGAGGGRKAEDSQLSVASCQLQRTTDNGPRTTDNVQRTTGDKSLIPPQSSVEETALAVEALLAEGGGRKAEGGKTALEDGIHWLLEAIAAGRHREPAPIGLYFAKLWYYEKVYPLAFAVAALGRALRQYPTAEGSIEPRV